MPNHIIRYRLAGMPEEGGHLRLAVLLAQLQNLSVALKCMDKLVTGKEKETAYYRVVDLKHSSPAEIAVEAVPLEVDEDYTAEISNRFYRDWKNITEKGEVAEDFDTKTIEAFERLISPLGKDFASASLVADDYDVNLTDNSKEVLKDTLATEISAYGTVEGKLEAINLHNNANQFRIFPLVGAKVITCKFNKELRETAKTSLDSYVSVTGKLHYKSRDKFPHRIEVDKMVVYPPPEKLPHLADLRGVAPNATGEMSSAEFVGQLRDAWQ